MSDPVNQNEELGGRRKRRNNRNLSHFNKKRQVLVGKIYADWCGHCQMLKPEWIKMKTDINTKKGNKQVSFAEVEENEIETKLRKIEQDNGVKIEANGYPTLFRIESGHVKYYNGERTSHKMSDWFLRGGGDEMVGGKTYHRKRFNSRSRHHPRRFNNHSSDKHSPVIHRSPTLVPHFATLRTSPRYTRKNRSSTSSQGGLFGFLFGK